MEEEKTAEDIAKDNAREAIKLKARAKRAATYSSMIDEADSLMSSFNSMLVNQIVGSNINLNEDGSLPGTLKAQFSGKDYVSVYVEVEPDFTVSITKNNKSVLLVPNEGDNTNFQLEQVGRKISAKNIGNMLSDVNNQIHGEGLNFRIAAGSATKTIANKVSDASHPYSIKKNEYTAMHEAREEIGLDSSIPLDLD